MRAKGGPQRRSLEDRFLDLWFAPIDPINLRVFETCFALAFLLYLSYFIPHAREWLTAHGYHVSPELLSVHNFAAAPLWKPPTIAIRTSPESDFSITKASNNSYEL